MRGVAYAGNDPRLPRMRQLEEREAMLLAQLEILYQEALPDG